MSIVHPFRVIQEITDNCITPPNLQDAGQSLVSHVPFFGVEGFIGVGSEFRLGATAKAGGHGSESGATGAESDSQLWAAACPST